MTAAQYDPASETPIHSPVQGSPPPPLGGVTKSPDLRILHFNDVYHIQYVISNSRNDLFE